MKLTKIFLAVAAFGAVTCLCLAQYTTSTRGLANNDRIASAATNTYYQTCEEFEQLPVSVSLKADTSSTAFVPIVARRSLDSTTYETTPFYVQWLRLAGTTAT